MTASAPLRRIIVRGSRSDAARGVLVAGPLTAPCALGRSGITRRKREGDGATPAGTLRLVAGYWRADRVARPCTAVPMSSLRPSDGWCDDPADRRYNRPVRLPYPGGHEDMWRQDHLYDIVVVLDWNLARPRPGGGSAIFFHLAAPGLGPTAGCIAVTLPAMRRLLTLSGPETVFEVG